MTYRKSSRCESSSCVLVELPQWRTASDCVEVALPWRKSSASLESNCVEVAYTSACEQSACVEVGPCCGDILVRDSKHPEVEPFRFTRDEWEAFIKGAKAGEFDMGDRPMSQ